MNFSNNSTKIASLALLVAMALAPQTAMAATPAPSRLVYETSYHFGFEETLKPWVSAAAIGTSGSSLERLVGQNGCQDLRGNAFANLKGNLDTNRVDSEQIPVPGTWIVSTFPAQALNNVRVAWNARSTARCEGCIPMVYIGTTAPTLTTEFDQVDGVLKNYWQPYELSKNVNVAEKQSLYVAIGWNGTDAGVGLDCLTINIVPLNSTAPPPTTD